MSDIVKRLRQMSPEQAARIEAERAEIEAAIADEVARIKGDRG